MQLTPTETFPIVRVIDDHTDTDTNYVQAVIKNARTLETIATVNLTDNGGQSFSSNWEVPADVSGKGFYITIITTVYTNSGYTTKNGNYGQVENTHLIHERVNPNLGHGGGYSPDIDYKRVRKIVKEEVEGRASVSEAVDLKPLLVRISDVVTRQDADIERVIQAFEDVKTHVSAQPVIKEQRIQRFIDGLIKREDLKGLSKEVIEVKKLLVVLSQMEPLVARAEAIKDTFEETHDKLSDLRVIKQILQIAVNTGVISEAAGNPKRRVNFKSRAKAALR